MTFEPIEHEPDDYELDDETAPTRPRGTGFGRRLWRSLTGQRRRVRVRIPLCEECGCPKVGDGCGCRFCFAPYPTQQVDPMREERHALELDQLRRRVADAESLVELLRRARAELHLERDQARAELEQLRAIIARVTDRMQEYHRHGGGSVNVRQVLNLLSPTWPDGNYAAPPAGGDRG